MPTPEECGGIAAEERPAAIGGMGKRVVRITASIPATMRKGKRGEHAKAACMSVSLSLHVRLAKRDVAVRKAS